MAKVNAELVKGVGKKSGKPYVAIDIELSPNYKKRVFLDSAETALAEVTYDF